MGFSRGSGSSTGPTSWTEVRGLSGDVEGVPMGCLTQPENPLPRVKLDSGGTSLPKKTPLFVQPPDT